MLQTIEEVGFEKGIEIGESRGFAKGIEKTAINLLRTRLMSKEQISEITGLDREKLDALEMELDLLPSAKC